MITSHEINHGKEILRELDRKTKRGKFKSFISYWFFKIVRFGMVSVYVVAGALSVNVVLGFVI